MEEQGFPCAHPGCGKIFTQKRNLRRHEKLHLDNRPRFPCSFQDCTAEFSRRSDLRIHQRTHAMLHPEEHRCPIASCKKAFLRSSDLKLHMRRHSNDRKYPCDVCHKLFYRPCDVATHMQRCHGPTPATSAHSSTSSASPESVSSCPSNSASIITPKPEPQCTRPVHGAPQDSDQSRSLVQPSNVVRRTGSCCGQSAPSPTATAALGDRSARASAGQYTPPSLCAATSSPDQDAPTSFLPPKDNGLLLLSQAVAHEDPHRWQVCPCGANCRCADCRCAASCANRATQAAAQVAPAIVGSQPRAIPDSLTQRNGDPSSSSARANIAFAPLLNLLREEQLATSSVDELQGHLCQWSDCSCGPACTCMRDCDCGSKPKTTEDWQQFFDILQVLLKS